jgi:hypothetical protein
VVWIDIWSFMCYFVCVENQVILRVKGKRKINEIDLMVKHNQVFYGLFKTHAEPTGAEPTHTEQTGVEPKTHPNVTIFVDNGDTPRSFCKFKT